jgi:hypothetical protein
MKVFFRSSQETGFEAFELGERCGFQRHRGVDNFDRVGAA